MLSVIRFLIAFVLCANLAGGDDASGSYARVASSGTSGTANDGPKIFKALHMDLNIPTTTRNETTEQEPITENSTSTGRAYNSQTYYRPARPIVVNRYRPPSIVYPQHRPSYKRIDVAMDRFTPGEATASHQFKKYKDGYNYNPPKIKSPSSDYVPPKDLYAFPPNIDVNYLPPTRSQKPKKPINSYIPPPAGVPHFPEKPIISYIPPAGGPPGFPPPGPSYLPEKSITSYIPPAGGPSGYPGPVSPEYLPPFLKDAAPSPDKGDDAKHADKTEDTKDMPANAQDDTMLPPLNSDGDSSEMPPEKDNQPSSMDKPPSDEMDKPPADDDFMPDIEAISAQSMNDSPPSVDHDHNHEHHVISDDDVPDHYHHGPSFYGSHGIDAYPEIIYDDHHDHHFHHHHPPPEIMMTTTTTTEAPEPPPEPRVKKYSYFYLGRKLWYIPLYFTVWFSFYILWLIVKSIARHKVNLPNHYTGRMMKRSATPAYFESGMTMESINNLTSMVLNYIESFERKYSNSGGT